MKKSIIFLALCFISIIIIFIYNVKINKKTEETIKLKTENFISNSKIKKGLIISESDYIEETTEKTTSDEFKIIGTLLPEDTAPIISKMGYKVKTESFKDIAKETEPINKNIVIEYPQLIGFKNKSLQNKINKEIRKAALEPIEKGDYIYDYDNLKWLVDYTIEYMDKNVISIVFRGFSRPVNDPTVRGTYRIYAVNINLNTGKKIRIDELLKDSYKNILNLSKVNECLRNNIYENKNRYEYSYKEHPDADPIVSELDSFNKSYDNFYIKENKFMFIIFLIRDDCTFAVDYSDLMDSIKWENEVWAGIFKKERG